MSTNKVIKATLEKFEDKMFDCFGLDVECVPTELIDSKELKSKILNTKEGQQGVSTYNYLAEDCLLSKYELYMTHYVLTRLNEGPLTEDDKEVAVWLYYNTRNQKISGLLEALVVKKS